MLKRVLSNYGSLATMRVLSRLLHFAIKTYLIRTQLNQQILARLLNLDLLFSLSLHPSYQKIHNPDNAIKSSMNIMTFGILGTVVSTVIVSLMEYLHYKSGGQPLLYFVESIGLYALSSILQSMGEKYMVECTLKYKYLAIGCVEVLSIVPKTLFIAYAAYHHLFQSVGILVFGISQCIYSLTAMLIFYGISDNKALGLQPFLVQGKSVLFDEKSRQSLGQFSMVSLVKLVLHEFQKIVLIVMNVSSTSSVYSLISNLGSVIVRYVFAPLNQIIFNHFSRGDHQESIKALLTFIRFLSLFSILIISFGYNYSQVLLSCLYGQKWVTPESIFSLRIYMVLVTFLGFNGVFESFLFARGQQSIIKYNYFSVVATVVYLISTVVFLEAGLGAAGLFCGSIVNMGGRIAICWWLQIGKHISGGKLLQCVMPSGLYTLITLLVCYVSHAYVGDSQRHQMLKLLMGGLLFVANISPLLFDNRQILKDWLTKSRLRTNQTTNNQNKAE